MLSFRLTNPTKTKHTERIWHVSETSQPHDYIGIICWDYHIQSFIFVSSYGVGIDREGLHHISAYIEMLEQDLASRMPEMTVAPSKSRLNVVSIQR